MTGQGFKITTGSLIFFSNVKEWKEPIQFKLSYQSIKNCQAISKSCIDRKYNAWFTLGSESEIIVCDTFLGGLPVTVLKSLNDRQSDNFLKF